MVLAGESQIIDCLHAQAEVLGINFYLLPSDGCGLDIRIRSSFGPEKLPTAEVNIGGDLFELRIMCWYHRINLILQEYLIMNDLIKLLDVILQLLVQVVVSRCASYVLSIDSDSWNGLLLLI